MMQINSVEIQKDGSFKVNGSMSIPDDMANRHRRKIQAWIDAGNTPTPYVAPEKSWADKRTASMADGGYSTWSEQLEMNGVYS